VNLQKYYCNTVFPFTQVIYFTEDSSESSSHFFVASVCEMPFQNTRGILDSLAEFISALYLTKTTKKQQLRLDDGLLKGRVNLKEPNDLEMNGLQNTCLIDPGDSSIHLLTLEN